MARRLPPLGSLRAFEAAARLGSFVAAADELAVTAAAVSLQVKQLEADLGVQLFKRLPRGLVLTAAGHAALPELRQGFAHLRRGVEAATAGELRGALRISVVPSFATRWLVPRLARFVAAYPEIDLALVAELRVVDFAREAVDVAVRSGPGPYPGLDAEVLMTGEVFPVCAPRLVDPERPFLRVQDLRRLTLLHDDFITGTQPWLSWSTWLREPGGAPPDLPGGLRFSDSHHLLEAAAAGLGVGLGQTALVAADLASGRLVRPVRASRPADYAYWIVTAEGARANPRVAAFTTWLREQAQGRLQNAAPRVP